MAFEIELKAWVDDRETVERRIGELADLTADFRKEDRYWVPDSSVAARRAAPVSGVRVRRETVTARDGSTESFTLVTYKTKEVRNGLEINEEKEFSLKAPPESQSRADGEEAAVRAFEELLGRLGLVPGMSKKKEGRAWKYGSITVELSELDRLGCFLELEILTDNGSAETVELARESLLGLLALIGIKKDRIETRYYNEMLAKL
ncbi:MAG: CYTH domain-containing protein [Spirochaetaceae bacterium]|jgi:adenylate cyclase class 2|nr:CYTH domain-containing protein [Spirochaetaceae bacterium]